MTQANDGLDAIISDALRHIMVFSPGSRLKRGGHRQALQHTGAIGLKLRVGFSMGGKTTDGLRGWRQGDETGELIHSPIVQHPAVEGVLHLFPEVKQLFLFFAV